MRDLATLKEKIERVQHRAGVARAARDKEAAALVEAWQQIRERYRLQIDELETMRTRVAELEDANDALTGMVDTLIDVLESSGRAGMEAVSRIGGAARALVDDVDGAGGDESFALPHTGDAENRSVAGLVARVEASCTATGEIAPMTASEVHDSADVEMEMEVGATGDGESGALPVYDEKLAREMEELQRLQDEVAGLRTRLEPRRAGAA